MRGALSLAPPRGELRHRVYELLIIIEICVDAISWYLRPVSWGLSQAPCAQDLVTANWTGLTD
jgi:hypothetical protein